MIECMSTSIDIYPTTNYIPLVEETRQRTQELYQQLLDSHGIDSTVEVKALHPFRDGEEIRYIDPTVRWDLHLGVTFAYWVNGTWAASSWPCMFERERVTHFEVEDYEQLGPEYGYPASMLGELIPVEDEFDIQLSPEEIKLVNSQDHCWSDERNMGGHAVSSIGYGFVAAALAEETAGRISSVDCALPEGHSGETAEQFLTWWGDSQLSFYGTRRFQ
ncbi:hypothetical protein F7D09_1404 [Bifidobacterium leontopitheci]|uniref:Uncharacterized protein n=2 Tax=Bifidobacterium leontopitheci TaxID=2650774 RepID=A0A6I1GKT4_9BIFI|nr:hypothetical protein F7D09_1404 [Bifidobacterium leontopitheci]